LSSNAKATNLVEKHPRSLLDRLQYGTVPPLEYWRPIFPDARNIAPEEVREVLKDGSTA
jgi:hypothetical protein